jgi:hypothetical protein
MSGTEVKLPSPPSERPRYAEGPALYVNTGSAGNVPLALPRTTAIFPV